MEFCPKCGALLMKKKTRFGCPRCNYISRDKVKLMIKEEVNEARPVAVVSEKHGEIHPITEFDCEKCGSKKSYFWMRQVRAGDEPESRFFRCVKCKNTVRVDN